MIATYELHRRAFDAIAQKTVDGLLRAFIDSYRLPLVGIPYQSMPATQWSEHDRVRSAYGVTWASELGPELQRTEYDSDDLVLRILAGYRLVDEYFGAGAPAIPVRLDAARREPNEDGRKN